MTDFEGPERGEYRALRETNTITGKHRWVVCKWSSTQTVEVGGTVVYSEPFWVIVREERFSTEEDAEQFISEFAISRSWVRDA